ncbi:MAG TPA: antitoxin Xre-like helix-turn-helix domain-containing protein [Myxococcaceae bacterium]|nr:antitoxin Xre-like helix-turn-helix domain-containing protein [Myxococcaceae bacterium]
MELFEKTAALLGGSKVLGTIPQDPLAAVELVRRGLPPRTLESLKTKLGTSLDDLAETLNLPKRTLERRLSAPDARLNDKESERVYRLARIVARAEEVFGDLTKAFRWLGKENRALGGAKPLGLLDTDVGTTAVEDVLTRIEEGVVS